jgi:hypothetical protein
MEARAHQPTGLLQGKREKDCHQPGNLTYQPKAEKALGHLHTIASQG